MSSHKNFIKAIHTIVKRPDLGVVISTILFVLVLISRQHMAFINVFTDQDPPWLIKTGLWILEHHTIPTQNPFANHFETLSNIPIVCYQWLFEILLGIFYQVAGLPGISIVIGMIYSLFILGLYHWLRLKGFKPIPYILLPLIFSLLALNSCCMARPVVVSCLLTSILLLVRQNYTLRTWYWAFPCIMALWANFHLGFVTGIIILGIYLTVDALQQRCWKPFLLWIICILATGINPYGFGLYQYFAVLANSPFMNSSIIELQPPRFNSSTPTLLYFLIVILSAIISWKSSKISLQERIIWLLSLSAGMYSAKHVYLLAIFSLPFLGFTLETSLNKLSKLKYGHLIKRCESSAFNTCHSNPIMCLLIWPIIAITLYSLNLIQPRFAALSEIQGIIHYLNKHHVHERILCNERWGAYLLFYTQSRCVLDTRMDMYGDAYVKRYITLYFMQGNWQPELDKEIYSGLKYAIYPKSLVPAFILQKVYHWTPIYSDKTAVLLKAPD